MVLTHHVIKHIDLGHEPGEWIEVRLPSLDIKERGHDAWLRKTVDRMSGMDFSRLATVPSPERDERDDSGPSYDWQTMLQACVVAWSYADPVTPENVIELDDQTVNAVMAVLVPRETAGDQKNG